jgi:hypothetical protein
MDFLLWVDPGGSEQALLALVAAALHEERPVAAATAAQFLIALLDHDGHPAAPEAAFGLLSRICAGDPDAAACGREAPYRGAIEATPEDLDADREARRRCAAVVASGRDAYLKWLTSGAVRARRSAAHLLAFAAPDDGRIDQSLSARARDQAEDAGVRSSALFALGVRGTASAMDLAAVRARGAGALGHQELGEATLLEAASSFAALGAKDAVLGKAGEHSAVDVLARGIAPQQLESASPWPAVERMLLARLGAAKGRSARAQTALLRLLSIARDPGRAARVASALLVLAFGEPTAAAFSDWRPLLERFPGATKWSTEQRSVLCAIADKDALWTAAAEDQPCVRRANACPIQAALKRMLELSYYPSRKGLRGAIALGFSVGAGGAGR